MPLGREEPSLGVGDVLRIILTLVLIALSGFGIYALTVLVGTLRSWRRLADDVDGRLPVLLEDADVAVQAASLELMRLDDILLSVQTVSDTAAETTRAASEAVHVPMAKVGEYAERARRFIAAMRER
jgi:hypothetical protein